MCICGKMFETFDESLKYSKFGMFFWQVYSVEIFQSISKGHYSVRMQERFKIKLSSYDLISIPYTGKDVERRLRYPVLKVKMLNIQRAVSRSKVYGIPLKYITLHIRYLYQL